VEQARGKELAFPRSRDTNDWEFGNGFAKIDMDGVVGDNSSLPRIRPVYSVILAEMISDSGI
jgi:hypothetical protein